MDSLLPPAPASLRRSLILRAGALGDTVVALPALAALRLGYPDARLVLVGNAAAGPLLQAAGHVDECHPFDARWVGDLYSGEPPPPELRAQLDGVDFAVVWSRNPVSPAVEALRRLGVPTLAAPSFPAPGVRRHVCDHLLDAIVSLGLPAVAPIPRLGIPDADLAIARDFWRANGLDGAIVVALHVGSGSARKNWPAERFVAVADRLAEEGRRVLLVSGPSDAGPAEAFRRAARAEVVVTESPRLGRLAALLYASNAYLGNDSGVSHCAAAVGTPTVAIFGPTDPALWAPRGPRVIVLWRGAALWQPSEFLPPENGLAEGSLDDVSVEIAWSAIEELLAQRP